MPQLIVYATIIVALATLLLIEARRRIRRAARTTMRRAKLDEVVGRHQHAPPAEETTPVTAETH